MIHPFEYGLIMIQLRHQEELRSMHDLEIPPTDPQGRRTSVRHSTHQRISKDQFEPKIQR